MSPLISSKQQKCGTDKGSVLKADKHISDNICHVIHFESPIYRNNLIINESCYKVIKQSFEKISIYVKDEMVKKNEIISVK